MPRQKLALCAAILAVTLVVSASVGAVATPNDAATAESSLWSVGAQENATDGTQNESENETETPTETTPEDVRNLTGDNQTAILAGNESAIAEANLTNATANETDDETLPSQQNRNGTFVVDGVTGVYDYAVVTARHGSLQLFVRNATIATQNGTATAYNTFVAIGDDLSAVQLRVLENALREPFGNATAQEVSNVSAVTLNDTANATGAETTPTPTNGTDQGNATGTAPQLADLALAPLGDALAAELPGPVLDQQVRVKADLVNVRTNDTVTTHRDVLLRGTLAEVLQGEAETADPEMDRTNDTEVTLERTYFDVSNLSAPETVGSDETYQVNATVVNNDEEDGAEEVSLRIAGEQVDQRLVRLDAGESTTVSFEVDVSELDLRPGTYEHGVYAFADSATAIVEIQENATAAE